MEEIIDIRNEIGCSEKTADSVYYITSGEAIIYNKPGGGVLMRLNRGQIFGESFLTKMVSGQYIGEIRCGLRPLSCIRFTYADLERILTFPEMAVFGSGKMNTTVSTVLTRLAEKHGIERKTILRY